MNQEIQARVSPMAKGSGAIDAGDTFEAKEIL